jgi:8-oxo-dGTP pyrophosphatase MutT (NUDIX family)
MNLGKTKMRPLKLTPSQKRDVRTQFGALCYRVRQDKVQVLLITSRGTGRWILPKGWPIGGAAPTEAAAQEAWEEAGVEGRVMGNCLGIYSYVKVDDAERLPCIVAIFPIKVKRLQDEYPEADQRQRKWFSLKKAANLLTEPELRQMVRDFDPTIL